jgi:hypothetical protein
MSDIGSKKVFWLLGGSSAPSKEKTALSGITCEFGQVWIRLRYGGFSVSGDGKS